MADESPFPAPCLIVLVGAAGSGKSTWAAANFRPGQVLSTDAFRALLGSGPADQTAGTEAFALLYQLLEVRLGKGLTTVIDTLALDPAARSGYRDAARAAGVPCFVVGFDTDPKVCHANNRDRRHPVPKTALDKQLRQWRKVRSELPDEGFDGVIIDPGPARVIPAAMASAPSETSTAAEEATGDLAFDLVVSSYEFGTANAEDIEPVLASIAEAAEATGFRALWVMDHFRQVPQVGRAWEPMLESYTTLAYLAAKTDRLRLGTLVTGIEHRNVGLLAKIIATLDVLSGGRAECGLGAGWFNAEQAAYGYEVNPNGVRLDTLEDAVQALPLLWGPGAKSFTGKVLSIPEAMAYPRPIQDPIPILVGGGGEKRTLQIAARYADACNFLCNSPADDEQLLTRKIAALAAHCEAADRSLDQVAVTTLNPLIHAAGGRELNDLIEALRPANVSAEAFAAGTNAATTDEHVDRFGRQAELGVSRVCVSLTGNDGAERVEQFRPVIAAFSHS